MTNSVRLVTVPPPAPRVPQRITAEAEVDGCRLILIPAPPAGQIRDLRAMGNPFLNGQGILCVRVIREAAWYRLREGRGQPRPRETEIYSVDQLWIE